MTEKTLMLLPLEERVEKLAEKLKPGRKPKRPASTVVWVEGQKCVKVPLTRGMFSLVDYQDSESVLKHFWTVGWSGKGQRRIWYAERRIRVSESGGIYTNRHILLHHFLMGSKQRVDHKNGDGLDNRRCNLRHATSKQNNGNRGLSVNSTTGFKGVFYRAAKGNNKTEVWRAIIASDSPKGSKRHLGYFKNPIDAAKAYNAAAIERWGEFAKLNIIP